MQRVAKPKRTDEKYWPTTNTFDHIQYELDLEKYIILIQPTEADIKLVCENITALNDGFHMWPDRYAYNYKMIKSLLCNEKN